MKINTEFPQAVNIVKLFDQLNELDYFKFSMPYLLMEEKLYDRSIRPPSWLFRFKEDDNMLMEKIITAVRDYEGAVKWNILGKKRDKLRGTNWFIAPQYYFDNEAHAKEQQVTVKSYCEEHYPEKGKQAFADVENFARYLCNYFNIPYESL